MIRVGKRLQDARNAKGLSLEDIAKATKIKKEFLYAIENGDYKRLPSSAYAYGFVGNYAAFLGFPRKETVAMFRREFDEDQYFKILPEGFAKRQDFPLRRFHLKETVLLLCTVFILLVGYFLFQYRYAIINPPLSLTIPKENEVVRGSEIIITGQTEDNASVLINEMSVSVDSQGVFKKRIDVLPGKETITVTVTNRFGKKTSLKRHILVEQVR